MPIRHASDEQLCYNKRTKQFCQRHFLSPATVFTRTDAEKVHNPRSLKDFEPGGLRWTVNKLLATIQKNRNKWLSTDEVGVIHKTLASYPPGWSCCCDDNGIVVCHISIIPLGERCTGWADGLVKKTSESQRMKTEFSSATFSYLISVTRPVKAMERLVKVNM